jgi:hypothetical protein
MNFACLIFFATAKDKRRIILALKFHSFGMTATQSTSISICGGKTTCTVVRAG